jgi:hypothetical protein
LNLCLHSLVTLTLDIEEGSASRSGLFTQFNNLPLTYNELVECSKLCILFSKINFNIIFPPKSQFSYYMISIESIIVVLLVAAIKLRTECRSNYFEFSNIFAFIYSSLLMIICILSVYNNIGLNLEYGKDANICYETSVHTAQKT